MSEWQPIATAPEGVVVLTRIDDGRGVRNEARLKKHQRTPQSRPLWFLPDGSMYVYYEPTHWRPLAKG